MLRALPAVTALMFSETRSKVISSLKRTHLQRGAKEPKSTRLDEIVDSNWLIVSDSGQTLSAVHSRTRLTHF